jgi:hypothetical protein
MAKRKKQRRSNPNKNAISIINGVEGVMIANVWTEALFNNDAWSFLTAGTALNPDAKWTGQGTSVMSLKELIMWPSSATGGTMSGDSRLEVIQNNISGEWFNATIQSTLIGVGGKLLRKVARKPIAMGNKLLKQAGLRSMVRF